MKYPDQSVGRPRAGSFPATSDRGRACNAAPAGRDHAAGATEAENHAALAEYRQKQNRWDEAIQQWSDVAKLRALEPTGLLKLAEAQLHQKQWDTARATIDKLQRTEWPSRFSDVANQTRRLQEQLPK